MLKFRFCISVNFKYMYFVLYLSRYHCNVYKFRCNNLNSCCFLLKTRRWENRRSVSATSAISNRLYMVCWLPCWRALFNSQLVNFADLQDRFQGHYTNHSLRALAVTRLYDAGIDEQLITEKTGHRSTSVRSYKRMNEVLQQKSQQDHSWGKGWEN